jgi:hypothetical protein
VISQKQYSSPDPAAEFDRIANPILSDILAANPWIQRFCFGTLGLGSRNSHKTGILTGRYAFLPGVNLMSINPHVKICAHIRVTGIQCGSPALREKEFCYFHQRMIRGVPTPKNARIHPMALIETEESIQVALMETINAIVRNQIDLRRADLILKALHIAVKNSRRVAFNWDTSHMIRQSPEFETPPEPPAIASAPADQPVATPPRLPPAKRIRGNRAPKGQAVMNPDRQSLPANPVGMGELHAAEDLN